MTDEAEDAELAAAGVTVDPGPAGEAIAEAVASFGFWDIFPTAYPQQREFIAGSSARNQLFCGGRGTGKTWAGALKALLLALLNPGREMEGGGVQYTPGGILGRTAHEVSSKLEANFLEHVAQFKRVTGLELVAHYSAKYRRYTLVNGAMVYMLPYGREDTLAKIRGYDWAWAWIDEIMFAECESQHAYLITVATLRFPGATEPQIAITSSPDGVSGVMAHFYQRYTQGDPGYFITSATVFDNPHISDEFRTQLESGCTPAQWAAEGLGQLLRASNTIYADFSRDKHIVPWEYDRTLPTVQCNDWGDNWGWSGAAQVVNRRGYKQNGRPYPLGSWVFYTERQMVDGSLHVQQGYVDDIISGINGELAMMAGDRAVPKANSWLIGKYGAGCTFGVKTLHGRDVQKRSYGIGCVRFMLNPGKGKPPLLYFSTSLDQGIDRKSGKLIASMGSYGFKRRRDETGGLITTNQPEDNTPPTHAVDGLRYGIAGSAMIPDLHGGAPLAYSAVRGGEPKAASTQAWRR